MLNMSTYSCTWAAELSQLPKSLPQLISQNRKIENLNMARVSILQIDLSSTKVYPIKIAFEVLLVTVSQYRFMFK